MKLNSFFGELSFAKMFHSIKTQQPTSCGSNSPYFFQWLCVDRVEVEVGVVKYYSVHFLLANSTVLRGIFGTEDAHPWAANITDFSCFKARFYCKGNTIRKCSGVSLRYLWGILVFQKKNILRENLFVNKVVVTFGMYSSA